MHFTSTGKRRKATQQTNKDFTMVKLLLKEKKQLLVACKVSYIDKRLVYLSTETFIFVKYSCWTPSFFFLDFKQKMFSVLLLPVEFYALWDFHLLCLFCKIWKRQPCLPLLKFPQNKNFTSNLPLFWKFSFIFERVRSINNITKGLFIYTHDEWVILPAADYSFAGQCQVKEGLAQLEGEGIFQCLAVNDQCKLVFFLQRITQGWTVACERGTSSLQRDKHIREDMMSFNSKMLPTCFTYTVTPHLSHLQLLEMTNALIVLPVRKCCWL